MNFIALKMLLGDRTKYAGLLFWIALTSFLVTFAASYFGGMMTRSFALIAENPRADVWVMDAAIVAVDRPINLPMADLSRVRSVEGVQAAVPLAFVRFEPYVVPKKSLTGDSTERVDTRVLQVVFSFTRGDLPIFVGQQMDVFIDTPDKRLPNESELQQSFEK